MVYDTNNTSYGAYYNYYTASAGTISSSDNTTEASYSICPKGWKLPSQSEYSRLLSAYSITDDTTGSEAMRSAPMNFVYSGYHNPSGSTVCDQGSNGYWWLSAALDSAYRYVPFIGSSLTGATGANYRNIGFSVRCVSCAADPYTISYNLNSGTAGSSAPARAYTDEVMTISNPTRIGYTFTGWTYSNGTSSTAKYGTSSSSITTSWSSGLAPVTAQYFKNL